MIITITDDGDQFADMKSLPDEVLQEFIHGNFVIKMSERKFCHVDPDQAQEWLNGTGKSGGGIIGITKNKSALCRWALSCNFRSQIAYDTKVMYDVHPGETLIHNEATPSRQKKDHDDELSLFSILQSFKVFSPEDQPNMLQSVATKYMATTSIQDSLLNAKDEGQKQLEEFVKTRLIGTPSTQALYQPVKKNKAPTFETLFQVVKQSSDVKAKTVLKSD